MFPITLDLTHLPVALVGNGSRAARRLDLLDEAGAKRVAIYAPDPGDELAERAGLRLQRRWPTSQEVTRTRLLLISGEVEDAIAGALVAAAREAGTLVNVEDRPAQCDFHSPATLRRGDLLIAISTGGRSPALARRLRRFLAGIFGPEWRGRLDELARLRGQWRHAGTDAAIVAARSDAWLDRHGLWLAAEGVERAPLTQ